MKENKSMGKGNFANMPTEAKMKAYPKPSYSDNSYIDDTMTRIDNDTNFTTKKLKSHRPGYMY
jgi:hypothetical protein